MITILPLNYFNDCSLAENVLYFWRSEILFLIIFLYTNDNLNENILRLHNCSPDLNKITIE